MSQFLTPFDPTSATTGTLVTNLGQDAGVLLVLNDSAVNLKFTFGDGSTRLSPAQSWRRIDLPSGNPTISWQQVSVLSIPVPTSQVLAEAFAASESIEEIFPASLVRANAVTGTLIMANQIINNGAAPGTNIISSSDNNANDGSNTYNNDGSRTVKLNDNGTSLIVEQLINGTGPGVPTAAVAKYGAPSDLQVATFYGSGILQALQLGGLTKFGGITTCGTPGAGGQPVGLAIAPSTNITSTASTYLFIFSAPSSGLYRGSATINHSNPTPGKLQIGLNYTERVSGLNRTEFFWCPSAGVVLNGSQASTQANGVYAVDTLTVSALAGQNIGIFFIDPVGTPNDFVSAYLEFLS